ncbi:hypothetical protein FRACA_3130004 [Frankia canadensis]|uniref:Uncharacterized protein n=1 Tax=Frankia canadensis TaxID=1836972 RepID=A0A2I2KUE5_9ACTN|nr:hypothetical protein FRACA_3130004 [Frankia canadensis]SOU56559.1 hypothetical protein FRACA_3130004 [Frankia canadensis]
MDHNLREGNGGNPFVDEALSHPTFPPVGLVVALRPVRRPHQIPVDERVELAVISSTGPEHARHEPVRVCRAMQPNDDTQQRA